MASRIEPIPSVEDARLNYAVAVERLLKAADEAKQKRDILLSHLPPTDERAELQPQGSGS